MKDKCHLMALCTIQSKHSIGKAFLGHLYNSQAVMGAVDTYKMGHRTAHSQLEEEDHFITHPVYIKPTLKVE